MVKKGRKKETQRRTSRFTKIKVLKAIEGSGGIISNIAQNLKCDWHIAKKYVEFYPETKLALEAESEGLLDNAENALHNLISGGDGMMIRYYLSTKGRKRGYTERQEIDLNNNITHQSTPEESARFLKEFLHECEEK